MNGTYLVTAFADKDQVKALGARWDPARRQWYVPTGRDITPVSYTHLTLPTKRIV